MQHVIAGMDLSADCEDNETALPRNLPRPGHYLVVQRQEDETFVVWTTNIDFSGLTSASRSFPRRVSLRPTGALTLILLIPDDGFPSRHFFFVRTMTVRIFNSKISSSSHGHEIHSGESYVILWRADSVSALTRNGSTQALPYCATHAMYSSRVAQQNVPNILHDIQSHPLPLIIAGLRVATCSIICSSSAHFNGATGVRILLGSVPTAVQLVHTEPEEQISCGPFSMD